MKTMTNSGATNVAEPIPALDLKAQYATIREEILAATEAVLDAQHFILGPEVKKLEAEIAAYLRCGFGLGVASGTDALILGLKACDIGPGDEVLCPSFTFIATADAVSLLGATPVFVDTDPHTFTIDPSKIEARVTPRTKAIIAVHLYGQAADMDPILEIARARNLRVIEDTAQALGAIYKGQKVGTLGDIGCLSFFPSKNLGGCGDGGMIVTNSEALAKRVRSLRSHGAVKKYFSEEQGWNSRLDEIQAAILRVKLRYLEHWSAARREKAARYDVLLKDIPGLKTPRIAHWGLHVFHQYTICVPNRDQVQKFLADRGIASTVYYPWPIHLQPIYKNLGYHLGDFPETERAASNVLSLPIYPELTETQMQRVADTLAEVCASFV
jgi:dTDP-4-amino-4,6-dideoxygalactose transaminase